VAGIAIQNIAPAPTSDDLARVVPTQLGVVSRVPTIVVDDCGAFLRSALCARRGSRC
jgi:hypothetical protein